MKIDFKEACEKMMKLGYITNSQDVIEKHEDMCRAIQSLTSNLRYSSEVIKDPGSDLTQTETALKNIILFCVGELYKRGRIDV